MQRGFVSEVPQGFPHFRKKQFRFVAEAEEGFGAAQPFPGTRNVEYFFRSHRMRARITGIAAEGAISTVVTAEVGQRDEHLTRVGDHGWLEALFGRTGGGQKIWQVIIWAPNQA